jgi:UDP:flavonoid glycosyltransferase YjiC (YdhE family)
MRILFTSQPVRSHLHSLAPVALAAKAMGHRVGIASGPSVASLARRLGFDFLPCGLDLPDGVDPTAALSAERRAALAASATVVQHLVGFSAGMAPPFVRDLLELGPAWRPDVIVREPVEFGGVIAAERWGLPYATVMWALTIDPRYLMREAYAEVIEGFGLDANVVLNGFDRYLVIRSLPPEWGMATPDPAATRAFAVPPFDGAGRAALPDWFRSLPSRPTVYVTLGLSFSRVPAVFRAIIDALGGLDVNVIVTVGVALHRTLLGRAPANVRIARYLPANLLLPRCDAIVFHGGYNTLHAALWHGLPAVVVPLEGGDQLPTAEHVATLGLGMHVPGPIPIVLDVRRAVMRVLDEPSFMSTARHLQRRMHALPPVDVAIAELETLSGGR